MLANSLLPVGISGKLARLREASKRLEVGELVGKNSYEDPRRVQQTSQLIFQAKQLTIRTVLHESCELMWPAMVAWNKSMNAKKVERFVHK
jgi:maltodextrin utilization protein YvdJ